ITTATASAGLTEMIGEDINEPLPESKRRRSRLAGGWHGTVVPEAVRPRARETHREWSRPRARSSRAAASRCEIRVDWGPVSEYALVLRFFRFKVRGLGFLTVLS